MDAELRPVGPIHFGLGSIAERLPEKVAWDEINKQVGGLFTNRLLEESGAPVLLRERAWEILLYDNPSQVAGMPPGKTFMEILGYPSPDAVASAAIADVVSRVRNTARRYVGLIQQQGAYPEQQWWSALNLKRLCCLFDALDQLAPSTNHLEPLGYALGGLFSDMRSGDLAETAAILERLVPHILEAHTRLVERNLMGLADYLMFYGYRDRSVLVELSRGPAVSRGTFLGVTYALLPSVSLPGRILVHNAGDQTSFGDVEFEYKTLLGHTTSAISWGARFGRTPLHLTINGIRIDEPNATICVTRYPSRCPVLHQAYQLLGAETRNVMGDEFHAWSNVEHGQLGGNAATDWIVGRTGPRLFP